MTVVSSDIGPCLLGREPEVADDASVSSGKEEDDLGASASAGTVLDAEHRFPEKGTLSTTDVRELAEHIFHASHARLKGKPDSTGQFVVYQACGSITVRGGKPDGTDIVFS